MRALVSWPHTIRARFYDEDGTLQSVTGTVAVSAKNGAGTEIQTGSGTEAGTGIYTFALAKQSQLDRLTVTWTESGGSQRVVTTQVDVVGDRLAPIWRMKEISELASKSGETLRRLGDEVEEAFGGPWPMLGFPPVPEGKRIELTLKRSGTKLFLPDVVRPVTLYSVSVDGTAVTVADLEVHAGGWLEHEDGSEWPADKPITIHLSHGLAVVPEDLRDAALVYARYAARDATDKLPERATRVTTQDEDITLGRPSEDAPTGLPDVDAVITRLRAVPYAIA